MVSKVRVRSKILVVDDEPEAVELVEFNLKQAGFSVVTAGDGADALNKARAASPNLIVLDLMLPEISGLEVCKMLRRDAATSAVPIIMLTARAAEIDRVLGLELGADDYLTKPFSPRELLARIKAVIRRTRMLPPNLRITESVETLSFGRWRLDTVARHLLDEDGTIVALSGAEFRLLRVFLDHPQRVLSRDQLLNLTQGRDAELFDRSIDLLVSRLRTRLADDAKEAAYIKTVRSEGYVFSMPVTVSGNDA